MGKVYVGDTGTEIKLDTESDLSTATLVSIEAKRPDGTTVSWAGTVVELTKIRFYSQAGTFNQDGNWKLQAKAVLPSGTWLGSTVALKVYQAFG